MRLGHAGIRGEHAFQHVEYGRLVRIARKHAVQPHQVVAEVGLVLRQQDSDMRTQFVHLVLHDEDGGQRLPRRQGIRFNFHPELSCLIGNVKTAGNARHFHGALQHLRVARSVGQVGIGAHRQIGIAALQGQFSKQHLIDDLPRQAAGSEIARLRWRFFRLGLGWLSWLGRRRLAGSGKARPGKKQRHGCGDGCVPDYTTDRTLAEFHGFPACLYLPG